MKDITIYSTPTCHYCHMAKEYFDAHNIAYTDHNVAEDMTKRQEMVEMTSQMGVPVIVIGGKAMIGWNEAKVKELLAE